MGGNCGLGLLILGVGRWKVGIVRWEWGTRKILKDIVLHAHRLESSHLPVAGLFIPSFSDTENLVCLVFREVLYQH